MIKWAVRYFLLGAFFGTFGFFVEVSARLSSLAQIFFYGCVVAFLVTVLTYWIHGSE